MSSEELKIKVKVDGMIIPLRINRQDEEIYRNAEKIVKAFLKDYRGKYSRRTNEELLILTAYKTAVLLAKYDFNKTSSLEKSDMDLLSEELNNLLQSN